jgi:predicted nucleotidyltransferase component of viral defense system
MMIDKQIADLASYFRIDRFTIFREYLQLVFLSHVYTQAQAGKVYFKGGTAIHLLFDSPRFSEDLDFSTVLSAADVNQLIRKTEAEMRREILGIKILLWHRGKQGIRFKLIYKSADFKYPTAIRIDVSFEKPLRPVSSPLVTKFPIGLFPVVSHLAVEEIMAEKIRALLLRAKGRDVFDLWFLLSKNYTINQDLIAKKIGRKTFMPELRRKIANFSDKTLKLDLNQFLPAPMRKIADLKQRLKVLL